MRCGAVPAAPIAPRRCLGADINSPRYSARRHYLGGGVVAGLNIRQLDQ
jgi:hypothetical protein